MHLREYVDTLSADRGCSKLTITLELATRSGVSYSTLDKWKREPAATYRLAQYVEIATGGVVTAVELCEGPTD